MLVKGRNVNYMGTFPQGKICHMSNKSDIYPTIWADFFWNVGLANVRVIAATNRDLEAAIGTFQHH